MAITDVVLGWKAGSTGRNVVVALLHVAFLPLVIGLIPFWFAYIVYANRGGAAQKLHHLPGIGASGGVQAGAAAFVYIVVLFAVLGTAAAGSRPSVTTDVATTTTTAESGSIAAGATHFDVPATTTVSVDRPHGSFGSANSPFQMTRAPPTR
ncbi:hypothetical protein [Halocalculus aciditolerans]|uniref:Uncharacterized protein n=1 Tax=Halocalculus aciditolerans TaxID=1383812 RepID=A0A830FID9_9EURY|nr:hypothetical protein [Halocalculus aciditolerans]GGL58791.1 hypothetical protein GCM10009039_16270 [Halocalculus aciditolerans]